METFLDAADVQAETPTEPVVSFNINNFDLLGQTVLNNGYAFVGRKVTKPYNRVKVTLRGSGLSVNVGEAMFLHEVCTAGAEVDVPAAP